MARTSPVLQPSTVWRALERASTPVEQARARQGVSRLADIDAKGSTGVCLLMRAVRRHNVFATEVLLAAGANPNNDDAAVGSPSRPVSVLAYAFTDWQSFGSSTPPRPECVAGVLRALLDAGANPHHPSVWPSACSAGPGAALAFLTAFPDIPFPINPWLHPLVNAFKTTVTRAIPEEEGEWLPVWEALRARGADPNRCGKESAWAAASLHAQDVIADYSPEQSESLERLRQKWEGFCLARELETSLASPAPRRAARL